MKIILKEVSEFLVYALIAVMAFTVFGYIISSPIMLAVLLLAGRC